MPILPVALAGAVAVLQGWSPSPRIVRSDPLLVRAVIDGDTIDVATVGRVRLLGIDAPEIGRVFDTSSPFAREARDRLTSLVLRRWIRLEQEGQALDVYNRHLAYVITEDGQFVNAVLVREGLARVTAREPLSRLAELQRAEAEAQSFRRGMWGATPQIPPTSYTRPSSASRSPAQKRTQPAHRTKRTKKKRK
jgi:endonuclease YncB( thermonuclease family)